MSGSFATTARFSAQQRRALVSGMVGNGIEYYEFGIYGLAATLVFGRLFFPSVSPTAGLLLSLATFTIAFIARPLGGLVFGHFGDRLGRKGVLVLSMSIMGGATFCIGLLPTFDVIGVWAPILLVVLRALQGLSIGAEYSGSVLLAVEHAHPARRGFIGAIISSGLGWGTLVATLVFLAVSQLPTSAFEAWGWRIPFLLGGVLVLVCLFIRARLDESPEFVAAGRRAERAPRVPLVELVRTHGLPTVLTILMVPGVGMTFYIGAVFSVTYAASTGIDRSAILTALLVMNATIAVFMPLFGWLSDRYSARRVVLLASFLGMGGAAWVWFLLMNSHSAPLVVLGFVVMFIPFAACYATLPATIAHAFPVHLRFTGLALAINSGSLIGSGISPIVATALFAGTGTWVSVAAYLLIGNIVSFLAAVLTRETYADAAIVQARDEAAVEGSGDVSAAALRS